MHTVTVRERCCCQVYLAKSRPMKSPFKTYISIDVLARESAFFASVPSTQAELRKCVCLLGRFANMLERRFSTTVQQEEGDLSSV